MSHPQLELERQLCFSLYRASRAVTRAYRPLLDELGLTYPQYLVMLVLWQRDEPAGVGEIGEQLGLDSGTLTPLLRRLEQGGLVIRARGKDERRREVSLTEAGRELRERAATVPARMAARYPGAPREIDELKTFLDDLTDQLA
ncbi:MAG: MarR family transcriptional regulator [Luteococcus japonicus]